MKQLKLDYITIEPISTIKKQPTAVIYIHGWKGNKNSFINIAKNMKINDATWFFPEGPYIVDSQKEKKSWSYQKDDGSWEIKKTKHLLDDFIINIVLKNFKPKNIFFIGFSQGGAVCYEHILSMNYSFGGIFPYAGFIRKNKMNIINKKQLNTKIIIGHGKKDTIIDFKESERIYHLLKTHKANVKFISYPGSHKIPLSYLTLIKNYINEKN